MIENTIKSYPIGGAFMCRIIVTCFVFLFLLSPQAMSETAQDWFNKAFALSDGKKFSDPRKAVEYLNNAIKLQPNDAEAYYNRAVAYDNLGEYQTAIRDYNQAIRLRSHYAEAFCNRGILYNATGQFQMAIADFNEAIHHNPNDTEAYLGRGFAYDQLSQYQKASQEYSKVIALNPGYASAYNNRGADYLAQGNIPDGCRDAKKACELGNCKLFRVSKDKGICR